MSSSVDYRDDNVESWILSKSQDYFSCGAKPGENIMPVELAIKREIAYRKRIMTVRTQTPVGSRDASMSSKETSPSQSLVGIKRKEPSCNFQCLPKLSSSCQLLQNRSVGLNRKLVLNVKQRTRVSGYKNLYKGLEENQEYIGQKGGQLWCNACNVQCSGEYCLAQHFMGKKHAACIEEIKNGKRRN
ncbi:uncharacterized protein LOC122671895 isoform X2 [Telopea speciosissima]|uniref:uncharacterized protein LOC122671895 isoform X2 n=1 Tax=Telopea speciosissima TaxID=54955 RepID=UPI001CC52579|nr:uncharacterized protein LOC122671895 isoform X2 [Telopea speciosissima]